MESKPKIIYVFGAGHSGSTLKEDLLGCHPVLAGLGEVHRLSITPCTRHSAAADKPAAMRMVASCDCNLFGKVWL